MGGAESCRSHWFESDHGQKVKGQRPSVMLQMTGQQLLPDTVVADTSQLFIVNSSEC